MPAKSSGELAVEGTGVEAEAEEVPGARALMEQAALLYLSIDEALLLT